jgi:predicted anti-sigma-YlaC factor YlaD
MMERIKQEQSIAISRKRVEDKIAAEKKERRIKKIKYKITRWTLISIAMLYFIVLFWSIIEIRKTEKPELGTCWIPKGTWPYQHYNNLKWVDCEN